MKETGTTDYSDFKEDYKDKKAIIEALLFVSNNPVTKEEMQEVLKLDNVGVFIDELNGEYERTNRSFRIEEIAGGWQMRTRPEFSPWVKLLLNIQRRERLSGPALETLAIIAYKQPITKVEIEGIRGVNVDWVLSTLVDKSLVRVVGRKDIVGRPFMYGTATRFLEHFGLASLKDLPNVEELKSGPSTRRGGLRAGGLNEARAAAEPGKQAGQEDTSVVESKD